MDIQRKAPRRLKQSEAWEYYNAGKTDVEIAELCNVDRSTVKNWRRRNGLLGNVSNQKKPKGKKLTQLEQDAIAARELGMTYGQYKAQQFYQGGGRR